MRQSLQIARHPWHDRFRRWSDCGIDAKIMHIESVAGSSSALRA
jgi:hypothetical protein